MTRTFAIALALLAAAPAQDARKWGEALALFQKFGGSRDPLDRARAVDGLGSATSEKYDRQCLQLVAGVLRQEIARDPGGSGKNEKEVSGDVLEACLGALRKITSKEAVAELLKGARSKGENPRARLYFIWALGVKGEAKDLAEFLEDKNPLLQIAGADALAERAERGSVDHFFRILRDDRPWEAKLAALRGLEKAAGEKEVDALIAGLEKCKDDEGRLKDLYMKILKKLVGADARTDDPNAWKAVWAAKKAGQSPAEPPKGATVAEPTDFYGLKTRSTRIVFLLDRTGSMELPGSEPERPAPAPPSSTATGAPPPGSPKEPAQETQAREEATRLKKKYGEKKCATRMDVVKKELINTVYALSPKVHFNVVWYEGNSTPWKEQLVPATWTNKLDCMKETDRTGPSGPTNIWDAVELGLRMVEGAGRAGSIQIDRKANYATAINGADTFFLMTDGKPNNGKIINPGDILAEIRKVIRLRKIAIHSICVGDNAPGGAVNDPPDPAFLKRIADESGGDFVHLKK